MDKWEAQYKFWSGFGIPAYEENSVPELDKVDFPYITFPRVSAGFNGRTTVSPSIWTRSTSWLEADTLADAVYSRLGNGGEQVLFDGGSLWIVADPNSFAQSMGDPSDDMIKRQRLSVVYDFS